MTNTANENGFADGLEQIAAFQKLWLNSFSRLTQAALSFSPHSAPPEMLREIRDAILKSLAQEWDNFMRSPQFLEGMRQMLDGAVNTRRALDQVATRTRHELQSPALEDINAILLATRHMETRILEQLNSLQAQITEINGHLAHLQRARRPAAAPGPRVRRAPSKAAAATPASAAK